MRQMSRLLTLSALSSMNLRRGSTSSPISVEKMMSASYGVLDPHLQQRARLRVHRRLPELLRVHLAEALVALDLEALARLGHDALRRPSLEARYRVVRLARRASVNGGVADAARARARTRRELLELGRSDRARGRSTVRVRALPFGRVRHDQLQTGVLAIVLVARRSAASSSGAAGFAGTPRPARRCASRRARVGERGCVDAAPGARAPSDTLRFRALALEHVQQLLEARDLLHELLERRAGEPRSAVALQDDVLGAELDQVVLERRLVLQVAAPSCRFFTLKSGGCAM